MSPWWQRKWYDGSADMLASIVFALLVLFVFVLWAVGRYD